MDEVLNITVFGESLLNDGQFQQKNISSVICYVSFKHHVPTNILGVAVVLYHMFEAFCETGIDNVNGKDIGFGLVSRYSFLPAQKQYIILRFLVDFEVSSR